jgi:hypothetical protein
MNAMQFGEKDGLTIKSESPRENRDAEAGQHSRPAAA